MTLADHPSPYAAAVRPARQGPTWLAAAFALLLVLPTAALAQIVPTTPLTVAGGHLTLGAQASASVGTNDEGYFNYSSYDFGLLRLFRVDGTGDLRLNDRISFLGDLRVLASTDGGNWQLRPYAAFVRVRPWRNRSLDIQAGLVPPVFGSFSRRSYETDNPLIGYPLAYQYLTSLRGDALPASAEDLLDMRGRGWRASYPVGSQTPAEGLPLVDGIRYQAGVEAHIGSLQPLEAGVAWTSGSLSTPSYSKGNGWEQISGRVAVRPTTGLILGVSGSSGVFLSRTLLDRFPSSSSGDQRAFGFDAEYSRGHWLLKSEGVLSEWQIPEVTSDGTTSLRAFGVDLEARYRISPGLYAAARIDNLGFSDIAGPDGQTPWDAPVRRVEVGAGYSIWRNSLVKVVWQYNHRSVPASPYSYSYSYSYSHGTAETHDTLGLVSAQVIVWF